MTKLKATSSVLALAIGLAFATSADSAPAKTDGAGKAGGAAFASGNGNQNGNGTITVTATANGATIKSTKANGTGHAVATGHADGVDPVSGKPSSSDTNGVADSNVSATLNKKGIAQVTAVSKVGASATATDSSGKKVAIGSKPITVTATAKGGAKPTASTNVKGANGKIIVKASATAGVGATASGGKTVIKHFGPGGQDEIAITYTKNAYSAAVETPKSATAYSGYAKNGVVFNGPTLVATIEMAAFAYASASNNNAIGFATSHTDADSRGDDSQSNADTVLFASAFVNGNTVLLNGHVAGSKKLTLNKLNQVCTYSIKPGGAVALTCHSVGP